MFKVEKFPEQNILSALALEADATNETRIYHSLFLSLVSKLGDEIMLGALR